MWLRTAKAILGNGEQTLEARAAVFCHPQGPQLTDLKHALALVKGELGTRDVHAPYITVHGGIKGLWTGL
jgi:hypothetical protein